MSNFVWIVSSEQENFLGSGGVSSSYIIPYDQMNGHSAHLEGNRIWIVLRRNEDRCIAVASIKMVEKFKEGYYKDDFLISCDTTKSFRLSSSFLKAKPYALNDFSANGLGMHSASVEAVGKMSGYISNTVQVKFSQPVASVLRRVKLEVLPKRGESLAKAIISYLTQALPLDEVWGAGTGDKLGPFSNFASRLLTFHGFSDAQAAIFLKENDPVYLLTKAIAGGLVPNPLDSIKSIKKGVDLDFTRVVPDMIYARKFVPSEQSKSDLEGALAKTEAAEKLHQEMLRDIVSYLSGKGVLPYESLSIDLMISLEDTTCIFEIKSAMAANITAQAAKGAFQIACYFNAMVSDYQPLKAALILHKIEDAKMERFVHDALDRLNVKHLTYDPQKRWPDRVKGLLESALDDATQGR